MKKLESEVRSSQSDDISSPYFERSPAPRNALSLSTNLNKIHTMTPSDRQSRLVTELLRIEDAQERLAYVMDRAKKIRPFSEHERTEERRIKSCITKVWLHSQQLPNGLCKFEIDSESAMVRGLAALFAEVYSETPPQDASQFRSNLLELARLDRMITPTRQQGLLELQQEMRSFAASHSFPVVLPPLGTSEK